MKVALVALVAALATVSCDTSSTAEASLAQCTTDSFSDFGKSFHQENSAVWGEDAYTRNWQLLCMKGKGFRYDVDECPGTDAGETSPAEPRCFRSQ